jgi:hypothetical protein
MKSGFLNFTPHVTTRGQLKEEKRADLKTAIGTGLKANIRPIPLAKR